MNKKTIIPALALILGTVATLGVATVSAQDNPDDNQTIIQKIAEKFGRNEDEVTAIFEEHREEKQATRQADFEKRLTEAVQNGTITEDQKQYLLDNHAQIQAQREELRTWAIDNDIDLRLLFGAKHHPHHRGMH